MHDHAERHPRHTLPPAQLGATIDFLAALLAGVEADSPLALRVGENGATTPMPAAVAAVVLDAVSLLAARDNVVLLALDGRQLLSLPATKKLLGLALPLLQRRLKTAPVVPLPSGTYYTLDDVLAAIAAGEAGTPGA